MYCPGCQAAYLHPVRIDRGKVDGCHSCGGFWLRPSALTRILGFTPSLSGPDGTNHRQCPRDSTELDRVFVSGKGIQDSVELDQCSSCLGIWFDEGELETVEELHNKFELSMAPVRQRWQRKDKRNDALTQIYGIENPISELGDDIGAKFISRVYLLVAAGIMLWGLATAGLAIIVLINFLLAVVIYILAIIIYIFLLFGLFSRRRQRNGTKAGYFFFTMLTGVVTAPLPILMGLTGQLHLVLGVFLVTALIFVTLSLIVMKTRVNLEHWGKGLYKILGLMILANFLVFILAITGILGPNRAIVVLPLAFIGVILWSSFILFDTSRLLHKAQPGEEVLMATELFLDFVNLFIELLRIAYYLSAMLADGA